MLNKWGTIGCIPPCILWPVLAGINHSYVTAHRSFHGLWPSLIVNYIVKAILTNVAFTAVLMQVNHSVYYEDLGKVNGLGQTFASLARAIGPAVGGCLWSLSTKLNFVYLNFVIVILLYILSERMNATLPQLDEQKVHKSTACTDTRTDIEL